MQKIAKQQLRREFRKYCAQKWRHKILQTSSFLFYCTGFAKLLEHGQHSHDCMDTSHNNDTFIHWCLPVFGFPQSQNTIRNLRPIFIAKNMNTFQNLTSYDVMLRQWNIFTFHVKNELHLSNKRLKKISVAVIQTHVW